MTRRVRGAAVVLLLLFQPGCGDEGPNDELTYQALEGTWILFSLTFTSDANSSTIFDFRAAGGSGSLRFEADSTFLMILVPDPGSPTESITGPVALEGSTIVLTDAADPDFPLLSGSIVDQRLALETENAEYDFDGDGTDEPARVSAVFVR
jgi:hypothetical protein